MAKLNVDLDNLKLAIENRNQTIADIAAHNAELERMRTQLKEIDAELVSNSIRMKDFETAHHSIGIDGLKAHIDAKLRTQYEAEGFALMRDSLIKAIREKERDGDYIYCSSEKEATRTCWGVIYEAALSQIDKDSLQQLVAIGVATGKTKDTVLSDLKLYVDHKRLEPLSKQFGIPI